MPLIQNPFRRKDGPTALKAHPEPKARLHIRLYRLLRRKRVAYARHGAVHAYRMYLKEALRLYEVAKLHDVPMEPMPDILCVPPLDDIAGPRWINCKTHHGDLTPAIGMSPKAA